MEDSGKREKFVTGAVRDTADNKPRPDLISPIASRKLGEWLARGAKKYAARNWEKGINVQRSFESISRHLNDFANGETNEPHMVAVMCNAMFIIHTQEMVRRGVLPAELDDMPDYHGHRPIDEAVYKALEKKNEIGEATVTPLAASKIDVDV